MFKRALVSVSDKSGLCDFLKPYYKRGMKIVSSGGTAEFLRNNGFEVEDVSQQTNFPEVMGGRVKTLHPYIHMPILYRGDIDKPLLNQYQIEPFDLLVVNLYPFAQALEKGIQGDELIEFIDIGGPSLLRGAAKNFKNICVICDKEDYSLVAGKTELTIEDKKALAGKVFSLTSQYDAMIAKNLGSEHSFFLEGTLQEKLRYGENPQQEAYWYKIPDQSGWQNAEIIQGKSLSYNNLLDLDAAKKTLELFEGPAAVAVKHNNPCGVGLAADAQSALQLCLSADPVSVFGGIIALNQKVDSNVAKMMSEIFLECIVAPDFEESALQIFAKKKNLRILKWAEVFSRNKQSEVKTIAGGFLVQDSDTVESFNSHWKVYGQSPTPPEIGAINLAWKTVACLKSNAIAISNEKQTLGLGMGQVNRVDAVELALKRAKKLHGEIKNFVLASDAFFPFSDSVEIACEYGVKWIVQPGGSIKDEEVLMTAQKNKINMIITGKRHFRH